MIERQITIRTRDGSMGCFIVHPDRGGPFPVLLFFMDAPGIREELRDMARRLASTGYYVMLPNMYYRTSADELGPLTEESRPRIYEHMDSLDIPKVMDDADALLAFADADPAASKGAAGALGYCMSGQYAINAAARHPARIRAAASLYGVKLVTDRPDSPHLVAQKVTGEIYVAAAELDKFVTLDEVGVFSKAVAGAGVNCEVEIYYAADHGFAFPQRPAYDKACAERHWSRLNDLFARNLHAVA